MIHIETERRFLLRQIPDCIEDQPFEKIEQWYGKDGYRYRSIETVYSENDPVFYKTKKTPLKGISSIEEEISISKYEFDIIDKTELPSIRKLRSSIEYKGLKFEVDMFLDAHIIIMEIELTDEYQTIEFPDDIRKEILTEITDIKSLSNRSLAIVK